MRPEDASDPDALITRLQTVVAEIRLQQTALDVRIAEAIALANEIGELRGEKGVTQADGDGDGARKAR